MKKKVYLICGESACGKDTFANWLCKTYGMNKIISYATRPKRANEANTHIFINSKDVPSYKNEIIAYTKIGKFEYFATISQLRECDIYVIDPDGIEYLKSRKDLAEEFEFVTIRIKVSDEELLKRCKKRGDDLDTFYKRRESEKERFSEENMQKIGIDYTINNFDIDRFGTEFKLLGSLILNNGYATE